MTFSVFLPEQLSRKAPLPPVLYYLAGQFPVFCLQGQSSYPCSLKSNRPAPVLSILNQSSAPHYLAG